MRARPVLLASAFVLVSVISIVIVAWSLGLALSGYSWIRNHTWSVCSRTVFRSMCASSISYVDVIVWLVVVGIAAALVISLVIMFIENLSKW